MHVGIAQASSPVEQGRPWRPCVSTAAQVRVARHYDSLVPNLVSARIPEEDDPLEYVVSGKYRRRLDTRLVHAALLDY